MGQPNPSLLSSQWTGHEELVHLALDPATPRERLVEALCCALNSTLDAELREQYCIAVLNGDIDIGP